MIVAHDPGRHEPAIAAAHDAEPRAIGPGHALERLFERRHHIVEVRVAHPADDRAAERGRLAGTATWITEDDAVSGARVRVKLVEEPFPILGERPAMHVEQNRVLGAFEVSAGLHDPRIDLDVRLGVRDKPFRHAQRDTPEPGVVERRNLPF